VLPPSQEVGGAERRSAWLVAEHK